MADEQKCEASTTKRAWNNPLAPMAKCTLNAVGVVRDRWETLHVCKRHRTKLLQRGYADVPAGGANG